MSKVQAATMYRVTFAFGKGDALATKTLNVITPYTLRAEDIIREYYSEFDVNILECEQEHMLIDSKYINILHARILIEL